VCLPACLHAALCTLLRCGWVLLRTRALALTLLSSNHGCSGRDVASKRWQLWVAQTAHWEATGGLPGVLPMPRKLPLLSPLHLKTTCRPHLITSSPARCSGWTQLDMQLRLLPRQRQQTAAATKCGALLQQEGAAPRQPLPPLPLHQAKPRQQQQQQQQQRQVLPTDCHLAHTSGGTQRRQRAVATAGSLMQARGPAATEQAAHPLTRRSSPPSRWISLSI
jgi:hypothetical protein